MAYSSFNCSERFLLYKCLKCSLFVSTKTHKCKSGVRSVKYVCDKCPISSYSALWSLSHYRKHFQNKISKKTNNISLKKTSKLLRCDRCDTSFERKCKLNNHLNAMHTPDDKATWYACNKCNWKSKNKDTFNYHLKDKHSAEEKKFKCNECNYQTHYKSALEKHESIKHTPDHLINWHNCKFCSYRAKRTQHLSNHIKALHTSGDHMVWYRCNNCDFKAKTNQTLKRHLLNMHPTRQ